MNTHDWDIHDIAEAAAYLKKGEVVAFPTETVYGLGADATNEEAVRKIFKAKGRPSDNPLIIHVSSKQQLQAYVTQIPKEAEAIIERFWPGPCTIVFERKGPLAPAVTGDLNTVAVRMPDHPVALELIRQAGVPLAAPSANLSGRPSPTTADHVRRDLEGKISGIIDGGSTGVGLESTVIDLTNPKRPTVLRPGGVSLEDLQDTLEHIYLDLHLKDGSQAPKSPGMKYRHYSPDKPVYILPENAEKQSELVKAFVLKGERPGLLVSEETAKDLLIPGEYEVYSLGEKAKPEEAASRFYDGLRMLDQTRASVIFAEAYSETGIGRAYMNRLHKAAEWTE
ncbi:TsaC protein (YrdC-Sua5 domain) required for threonylcarbamoyladenosine t(6)A37 modification in tRNA [Alkalibacterium sp. AK22]|uniref:L-threonylcarbamoyladenylate synthase n=1 Tax=Alkalibacterium sp. AK22 TaxID=1229520 RepID=UPI000447A555|nr:L-threonylcarbamoyladenylate synthase [Alkalibacterium sp. AK22]EXJ23502.1 TsaC protein (YrdC-Sua5 domain) required for threonylcarbamoyladenosine t(6)A37 modification in tRNA [Alkalibacterium sp. AK22]